MNEWMYEWINHYLNDHRASSYPQDREHTDDRNRNFIRPKTFHDEIGEKITTNHRRGKKRKWTPGQRRRITENPTRANEKVTRWENLSLAKHTQPWYISNDIRLTSISITHHLTWSLLTQNNISSHHSKKSNQLINLNNLNNLTILINIAQHPTNYNKF